MQHNLLSNFLLFYTTIGPDQWLKFFSHFSTLPVTTLPTHQFTFTHHKCKNQIKTAFNFKQKIVKQQFDIVVVSNKQFSFLSNKQKNGLVGPPDGSVTIAEHNFRDLLNSNLLLGQKILIQKGNIVLQHLQWENYLIYYTELPNKRILLLIQEINAATLFSKNHQQKEVKERIKAFFDPIIYQIFGEKNYQQIVENYITELRETINNHIEMKRNASEKIRLEEKDKKVQYDFTLLFFHALTKTLMIGQN